MSDMDMTTSSGLAVSHLDETRAGQARQARAAVLETARAWATAPKYRIGAVALPGDTAAARAFDAFLGARGELASYVGGEAAARWAETALSAVLAEVVTGQSG